jgi:hypothetical protein
MEARLQRVHGGKYKQIVWPFVGDLASRLPSTRRLNLPRDLGKDGKEYHNSLHVPKRAATHGSWIYANLKAGSTLKWNGF